MSSSPVTEIKTPSTPSKFTGMVRDGVTKPPTCCGRKFSLCDCMSSRQLYLIAGVIGAVLLVFGVLALAGTFAPHTGGSVTTVLQKLKYATEFVAAKLGTNPFTFSIFTASFGAAFTLTGLVGLAIQQCRKDHAEEVRSATPETI